MAIIQLLRREAIGKRLHRTSDAKGVEPPTSHAAVLVGWDAIKPPPKQDKANNKAQENDEKSAEKDLPL
jgi:hypothetical protein